MSKKFSIMVSIEVEASTLDEAYGKVYKSMANLKDITEWESTDTGWYDEDKEYSEEEISEACSTYICRLDESGYFEDPPSGVIL
jgi:hypothetical protein